MERSNSLLAGACLAMSALAIAMFPGKSEARPNCPTCLSGYAACLASGASDCDTRYASCLRWCPSPLKSGTASFTAVERPIQIKPGSIALESSGASRSITPTRTANAEG